MNKKHHWEKVYTTKEITELSWFQSTPKTSLQFLKDFKIPLSTPIIDVGGGDSFFVDYLIDMGYNNITVLDISEAAINKAQKRLGKRANSVNWVISDILNYVPDREFGFWHDRATFHFLTEADQIKSYLAIANNAISASGKIVIGTFSDNGPEKCSGLPIKQYNESGITATIKNFFQKIKCIHSDHLTPFNTIQHFLFCSFKKSSI